MIKKSIALIIFLIFLIGGVFAFWEIQKFGKVSKPEKEKPTQEKTSPYFLVEKVYFTETEDPNTVLLNIKIKKHKIAYYKYEIHFPPQEGTAQGIGPIEVEFGVQSTEFKGEVTTTPETLIQESIARSYPDNVPEFGKSYFCKIKFYLTNGKEYTWEGNVGWGK